MWKGEQEKVRYSKQDVQIQNFLKNRRTRERD